MDRYCLLQFKDKNEKAKVVNYAITETETTEVFYPGNFLEFAAKHFNVKILPAVESREIATNTDAATPETPTVGATASSSRRNRGHIKTEVVDLATLLIEEQHSGNEAVTQKSPENHRVESPTDQPDTTTPLTAGQRSQDQSTSSSRAHIKREVLDFVPPTIDPIPRFERRTLIIKELIEDDDTPPADMNQAPGNDENHHELLDIIGVAANETVTTDTVSAADKSIRTSIRDIKREREAAQMGPSRIEELARAVIKDEPESAESVHEDGVPDEQVGGEQTEMVSVFGDDQVMMEVANNTMAPNDQNAIKDAAVVDQHDPMNTEEADIPEENGRRRSKRIEKRRINSVGDDIDNKKNGGKGKKRRN